MNPTFHRAVYKFARLCSALLGAALLGVVKRIQHFTEQRTTSLAFALPCSVLLCSGSSNEYNISPSSVQLRSPLLCLARCCSARGRQTNTTFHRAAYNFARLCSALLGAALLGVVKRIQHFTEQRTTLLAFALPCSVLLCSGWSHESSILSNISSVS